MRSIRGPALVVALAVAVSIYASADTPVAKTGTVVVRTEANYVAVGVAPKGGGKVENLFIFWPKEAMTPSVKRYERAHVEFEPGQLRIVIPDGKPLLLRVAGTAADGSAVMGIGLSHYTGTPATKYAISGVAPRVATACYLDIGRCAGDPFKEFLPAH
jgi:hypothetical protein